MINESEHLIPRRLPEGCNNFENLILMHVFLSYGFKNLKIGMRLPKYNYISSFQHFQSTNQIHTVISEFKGLVKEFGAFINEVIRTS